MTKIEQKKKKKKKLKEKALMIRRKKHLETLKVETETTTEVWITF